MRYLGQAQDNGQAQRPVPTKYKLSLPDIIHRFKTITTKKYIDGVKNNNWQPFNKHLWQRSFYDHIIRNDTSLHKIREYIINNPVNWDMDENNIKNNVGDGLCAVPKKGRRGWRRRRFCC
ncbi:MAG: transposase [Candidatus Omnitrophota bacterium]